MFSEQINFDFLIRFDLVGLGFSIRISVIQFRVSFYIYSLDIQIAPGKKSRALVVGADGCVRSVLTKRRYSEALTIHTVVVQAYYT